MRGQYVIDGIGGRMESMVKAVKISARNNVAEVEDHLDSPEKVFDTLEHELRLNNEYIGFAAAFIPDYYPSQGRWFEPYVRLADSTHIERKQIGSAQHDYFVQEWYVMGMHDETGEGYLSDPYYDADGGMALLCSYILPICDGKGSKVGLYCIDVKKEFLSDSKNIGESDDKPYFSIQIIDSKGQKIIGSDSLDTSILNGKKKDTFIGFEMVDLMGTPYYIHSRQLAGTDWTLVVFQQLTEAENARPEQFGRQRVIENVSSSIAEAYSPKELIETMTAAVRQFVGETEQSDDLTMLAIKYLCSHS